MVERRRHKRKPKSKKKKADKPKPLPIPPGHDPGTTPGGGVGAFVACARAQLGKRYVWATAGPDTFDCSGLVSYCYHQATGQAITRSSHGQYLLGVSVPLGWLPGDLLFWDTMGDGAGHVGVYVGSNRVVSAFNAQRGVIETAADGNYGGPYIGARRIL